jgi:hypothetical protein
LEETRTNTFEGGASVSIGSDTRSPRPPPKLPDKELSIVYEGRGRNRKKLYRKG